jgi:hypothetical protein
MCLVRFWCACVWGCLCAFGWGCLGKILNVQVCLLGGLLARYSHSLPPLEAACLSSLWFMAKHEDAQSEGTCLRGFRRQSKRPPPSKGCQNARAQSESPRAPIRAQARLAKQWFWQWARALREECGRKNPRGWKKLGFLRNKRAQTFARLNWAFSRSRRSHFSIAACQWWERCVPNQPHFEMGQC